MVRRDDRALPMPATVAQNEMPAATTTATKAAASRVGGGKEEMEPRRPGVADAGAQVVGVGRGRVDVAMELPQMVAAFGPLYAFGKAMGSALCKQKKCQTSLRNHTGSASRR